jgi:ubiquinol-cytochrome c reductase cytochrome c subunit
MRLFTTHCAGCHQVALGGGYVSGAVAPSLGDATATQIAEAVRIGPYVMPSFPESAISDRELDSIVAYVVSNRTSPNPGGWGLGRLGPVPEGAVAWLVATAALVAACVVFGSRLKT